MVVMVVMVLMMDVVMIILRQWSSSPTPANREVIGVLALDSIDGGLGECTFNLALVRRTLICIV